MELPAEGMAMRKPIPQVLGGALIGLVQVLGGTPSAWGRTIQITSNSTDDWHLDIDGSNVVWRGHDGSDGEGDRKYGE
jgi:hypothetical protein